MTLAVYTARVTYRGADRLDVSRKSAVGEAAAFAPTWAILAPLLAARRHWKAERPRPVDRVAEESALWATYCEAYTREMRASYVAHRPAWDALLARREATLVCYCTDPLKCHRTVLATILVKLGAVYRGERDGGRS